MTHFIISVNFPKKPDNSYPFPTLYHIFLNFYYIIKILIPKINTVRDLITMSEEFIKGK